jgi:hypothetical protein
MATKTADNPRWVYFDSSRRPGTANILVDGAATWYTGEFVRHANDGLLYEATSGAASGVGDDKVDYIAGSDITAAIGNDTTTRLVFGPIHEDDVFEMNELDGTVARAAIGQWYDLSVASNLCTVNVDSSSHAIFEVVEPKWIPEPFLNSSSDTLAIVYVQVLARTIDAARTN